MQQEDGQTSSQIGRLPQELIDKIVDELARPFREGLEGPCGRWGKLQEWESEPMNYSISWYLKCCSLVCRRFRSRCQFHLLAELRIPITQPGVACTHDFTITAERERMCTLSQIIQAKERAMQPINLSILLNFDNFKEFNHTEYADHVQLFQSIRQSSIRWRSLRLSTTGQGNCHGYRSAALDDMLLRPFIQTADITQITLLKIQPVPFTLLSSCPRLDRLICVDSKIELPSQSATSIRSFHVVHLVELLLYNTFLLSSDYSSIITSPLTWIQALIHGVDSTLAPLDISKLRTLQLRTATLKDSRTSDSTRRVEADVHNFLARQCGSHLSNLYVDIGHVAAGPVLFLPLHYFTNLAHLDVVADICELVTTDLATSLSSLCQWLAHLPHSRELTTINLHLTVSLFYASIPDFLDAGWHALESMLVGLFENSGCTKPRVSFFFALLGVSPGVINEIPGHYLEPRHEGDDMGPQLGYSWQWAGMMQKIGRYLFQVALVEYFLYLPGLERFHLSVHCGTRA